MYCAFWKFFIPIMILLFVSPLSPFSALLFHFSFFLSHFNFFPFFSFAHLSTALSVMSLIRSPPPFYPSVPFYTSPSLLHCSDSFFLCFTLFRGQVVEQLAYYIHVSETVITEETFDAAPPRADQDDLFACPLGSLQHLLGKEHQGQLHH